MKLTTAALLFSLFGFSQNLPLQLTIDSISMHDVSNTKRNYFIHYTIENKTNHEVSFFLKPNTLIAFEASSMTLFPVYKMYKNGVYEKMDGPFFERFEDEMEFFENNNDWNSADNKQKLKLVYEKIGAKNETIINEYKKNGGTNTDRKWILKNHELLQSQVNLNPNERKSFKIVTSWNRYRHFTIGEYEYYLEEDAIFELQLCFILNTSNRDNFLSKSEFLQVKNNPYFVKGVFESNRVKLNFN